MTNEASTQYYWHCGIQDYCGQTLYLIFVRYKHESIVFKKSVLEDMRSAGIFNYMIFELFSEWDILIRTWGTDRVANELTRLLDDNNDIEKVDSLRVREMDHIYDEECYASSKVVSETLEEVGLRVLEDVQNRGEKSEHFNKVSEAGLLLRDNISFDPENIQFYVVIRALHRLDSGSIEHLLNYMKSYTKIKNKTCYQTAGTSIRVIIKGQASDYYDISDFLCGVTGVLKHIDISTETIFVANRNVQSKNKIDFRGAEELVLEKMFAKFLRDLPGSQELSLAEKLNIKCKFHSIVGLVHKDEEGILLNLLRARATGLEKYIKVTKDFFPNFEQKLKDHLPQVIRKTYGDSWQETLDKLKESEGISVSATAKKLTMGDLAKLYKRIVNEHNLIDYSPISSTEFEEVMDKLPEVRNVGAHKGASLSDWDMLFTFCRSFMPIHYSFIKYFDILDR